MTAKESQPLRLTRLQCGSLAYRSRQWCQRRTKTTFLDALIRAPCQHGPRPASMISARRRRASSLIPDLKHTCRTTAASDAGPCPANTQIQDVSTDRSASVAPLSFMWLTLSTHCGIGSGHSNPNGRGSMRQLSAWALTSLIASASAQAGDINIGTVLVSGDVSKFDGGGRATSPRELSQAQLQALSVWLTLNRASWHGMKTETPDEPTAWQLNLRDKDGKAVLISVIMGTGGHHYLCLISSDKWSYRSFGGLVKSRAASRPVSDRELAVLRKILGTT
jgi:hypothetical protein